MSRFFYPDLTAMMIFHHEWDAVESCLSRFKKFYPSGEILLVRDSFTPYTPKKLEYLSPILTSKNDAMDKIIEFAFDKRPLTDMSVEERFKIVTKQVMRVEECARLATKDYLLALEYDAVVRKKVPVFHGVDLETLEVNSYSTDFIQLIQTISGKKVNFKGWGFVVGVAKRSALLEAAKWFRSNEVTAKMLTDIEPRMIFLDFLLPILVHLSGGNVANNKLTTECSRDKYWRLRKSPLLHQFRGKYVTNKTMNRLVARI